MNPNPKIFLNKNTTIPLIIIPIVTILIPFNLSPNIIQFKQEITKSELDTIIPISFNSSTFSPNIHQQYR